MDLPELEEVSGPKVSAAMAWVIGGCLFFLGAICGHLGHFPLS